jgi:hypothetical protein
MLRIPAFLAIARPFVRALAVYFNTNAQFCSFRRRHEAVGADVTSGIASRIVFPTGGVENTTRYADVLGRPLARTLPL